LREAVQVDLLEGPVTGVIGGKAAVIRVVPVLSGDDEREGGKQAIHHGNDDVTLRNGQCAAWKKVVLNVDEDEGIHDVRNWRRRGRI
jgi:hypothetical protein